MISYAQILSFTRKSKYAIGLIKTLLSPQAIFLIFLILCFTEYLHDSNAQAYIPQVVDGQLHLDTSAPIELQYNSENKLIIPDKNTVQQPNESPTTNVIHPDLFSNNRKPTLGLSSMLPLPATAQHVSANANMAPLNPAVQTHIRPMSTNGMAELKNYMQSQTLNENPELRGVITKPNKSPNMQTNHFTGVPNPQAKQQSATVKKKSKYTCSILFPGQFAFMMLP